MMIPQLFTLCLLLALVESSVFSPVSTNADSKRVTLLGSGKSGCSGILLSDDIVFTAAHCIKSDRILIRLNNQTIRAKQVFANEGQLKRNRADSDMAILILGDKVAGNFSEISVGCGSKWLSGECKGYGYGLTEYWTVSKEVLEVALNKTSLKNETEKFVWINYPTKAKTCKGDSGGPVICRLGKKSVFSGVISRLFGNAKNSDVDYCIHSLAAGITTSYSIFEYIHQLPKDAKDYILGHVKFENCAL